MILLSLAPGTRGVIIEVALRQSFVHFIGFSVIRYLLSPNIYVRHLHRAASDHSPLLIQCLPSRRRRHHFRFEPFWFERDDLGLVVANGWGSLCPPKRSLPLMRLHLDFGLFNSIYPVGILNVWANWSCAFNPRLLILGGWKIWRLRPPLLNLKLVPLGAFITCMTPCKLKFILSGKSSLVRFGLLIEI